jgi:prophage maintenance system killer protein
MRKKENIESMMGKIIIYKPKGGEVELRVKLDNETIWLTQNQIADLFGTQRAAITKHIGNIFRARELKKSSVSSILEHTAADGKIYRTQFYNLDIIVSVGYRINSKKATEFRIWATEILKNYLQKGYAVNEKRLLEANEKFQQLRGIIDFIKRKSKAKLLKGQEGELLSLLADYSKTLSLLGQYDRNNLKKNKGERSKFILNYNLSLNVVNSIKKDLIFKKEASDIFGIEVDHKFEALVKNIYQSFGGNELYESIEEKAANFLYFAIKDHPFTDGNKRIASFLFVYLLDRNDYLYRNNGEKKINDNALTALALLVAESNPKEKDQMVALITQLLE